MVCVCVHVVDFLWAGTKKFESKINNLSKTFSAGDLLQGISNILNIVSGIDGSITIGQFQYAFTLGLITVTSTNSPI